MGKTLFMLLLAALLGACAASPGARGEAGEGAEPHRPPAEETAPEARVETTRATPDTPVDRAASADLWTRIRAGFALAELDTPEVERFAETFARAELFERLAPRARRYLYPLTVEAEKRGLPAELALLPIVESGLNPLARSPADAAGLCQFIPATGRRFGLHRSALADRRMDLACMHAMYDYLEHNAALFDGDWHLALAAYNWGEGAVARAIERNRAAGLGTTYLDLRMPAETRAYVPRLLALKRLIAAPERHELRLPPLDNRPGLDCDVAIPRDLDVDQAARLAGISSAEFRQWNPGVRKGIVPRATYPSICLPLAAAARFVANIAAHREALASWTVRTVARHTTLATLARRHRTTAAILRAANEIPAGMRLRAGAAVLVPRARTDGDIPPAVAIAAETLIEPDLPPPRKAAGRNRMDKRAAGAKPRIKPIFSTRRRP